MSDQNWVVTMGNRRLIEGHGFLQRWTALGAWARLSSKTELSRIRGPR
jgi:hypothetical protein